MKTKRKYGFTGVTKLIDGGVELQQIVALSSFGNVKRGQVGGFIEKDSNLSHAGHCWVANDAQVYDNARLTDGAQAYDSARIHDNARMYDASSAYDNADIGGSAVVSQQGSVFGDANVTDHAVICGRAKVSSLARVTGSAVVSGKAEVTKTVYYSNFGLPVVLTDHHITVDDVQKTPNEWLKFLESDEQFPSVHRSSKKFRITEDAIRLAIEMHRYRTQKKKDDKRNRHRKGTRTR